MLQRFITAIILAPLVLLLIFYGPIWLVYGVLLLVLVIITFESVGLIPLKTRIGRIGFFIMMALCLWGSSLFFTYWLVVGVLFWVFIIAAILTYPNSQRYWGHAIVVAAACLLLFPLFIQSLVHVYFLPQGKSILVYLLFLIWASDIGAYLCGKSFGKHKLIPKVSPGKSWEGALGGIVLALCVSGIFAVYLRHMISLYWFFLAFCTVLISIFGDLFISILKRRCHVKDTGAIIPGHGGILDRLDSLIAAVPFFYLAFS